ncbi:hypothetical protein L7F22_032713 [Adiantum nelumboides]|nr:hypothetical protein [Adiantum nelumboides]
MLAGYYMNGLQKELRNAVAGVDVGAKLDNLVETATRAKKRFGVINPSSSKKKSKKKKKKGRKKRRSAHDSSEDELDFDSNLDTDTDLVSNLDSSNDFNFNDSLDSDSKDSIQSVEDAELGGEDALEELEVDEKFDVHNRDTKVPLTPPPPSFVKSPDIQSLSDAKWQKLEWETPFVNNSKATVSQGIKNAAGTDEKLKTVGKEFQLWADGLRIAIEKWLQVVKDKIAHLSADNNFLMNQLMALVDLEKATLDGQGVTEVLIADDAKDDRCIVRDRENGYSLITTGTLESGLFVLDRYEKQIQACIAETKTQAMQDAELWHARFGHVGYGSLMTLQRHNMVHDLSLLMPPRHVCEGCVLGKMHRFAFSQDGSVRATRKLQLVHSDVCGPMRTPSVGNSLYFVTFIDDFFRFCWVYPLKAKSDVFAVFQHYVSMVENETGCKVQTLRTDRGGEYMSGAFKDSLGKKGIKHQCTMPYTPQQNGVAERKNRSLMEMARCMLKAKSLPHKLWMEAVACVAHVLNRCPTRALKIITPYESWYDKKPSVSYLRVFGCLAYAHIPQQLRGKLDDKAVKLIFVGYSSGSKGYRLYNPATNKIFESRDVTFAEATAQPMVAFNVPHMQTQDVFEGFLPSFVENQESQQVDNFDQSFDQHVTPHDVEKIVREEQEVLREERTLPKWVQKTLQDSKLDAPLPRKTRAGGGNEKAPPMGTGVCMVLQSRSLISNIDIVVLHSRCTST